MCVYIYSHTYIFTYVHTCIHTHTHVHTQFFAQMSYLDVDSLELELPQEIIITLQVPSAGTVFHNEQELEVDLEEEILEQFRKKISGSLCYTYT